MNPGAVVNLLLKSFSLLAARPVSDCEWRTCTVLKLTSWLRGRRFAEETSVVACFQGRRLNAARAISSKQWAAERLLDLLTLDLSQRQCRSS